MPKDTENYNYSYSDIGIKTCVNECVWPQQYTPLSSREQAKSATAGYNKIDALCSSNEIDENTVEKSKMYDKSKGKAEYWVEINYKRTRTPKI